MRIEKIAGHRVEFFDAIEELPVVRYQKFNKMLIVDSGVGSDVSDVDGHLYRATTFIQKGDTTSAMTELSNLRQNIYFVQQNLSPRFLAFAAFVKSIDGKPCDDLSDEGLQRIVDKLSREKVGILSALVDRAKKKIDEELVQMFPKLFDGSSTKEYYDLLRRRTLLLLDCIISGKTKTKRDKIELLTLDLLTFSKPQEFLNGDVEVQYDRAFEKMSITIAEHLHIEPKTLSVVAFYEAYEYLKDKINQQYKRDGKRHKPY
jgi:hypothetical protein